MELYLVEFDTSIPLRETSSQSKFIRREPWFTPGLLTSSINKEKILSRKLQKPTVENISKYKIYNSIFNKLKMKMKIKYFKTYLIWKKIKTTLKSVGQC